jgi:Condensation domain
MFHELRGFIPMNSGHDATVEHGETGGVPLESMSEAIRSSRLSPAEERFWITYMLEGQSSAYHIPATLHLTGPLDVPALEEALRTVIARHDILRTRYPVAPDGELTAVVDEPGPCTLPVVTAEHAVDFLCCATAERFDLETGPLMRPVLLKRGDNEHYFHVTFLHIITDGWSIVNFLTELTAAYNAYAGGTQPSLPELTIQYRDYALGQRENDEQHDRQAAYWQRALCGAPTALGLRTDRPRQPHASVPGKNVLLTLPSGPALELARLTKTTLFMTLLGAYSIVLGQHANSEDVIVGTPVAGRRNSATEPLLGCFINTLAMRTDLSGDPTFRELMTRIRKYTLGAYDNQDVPFQRVADAIEGERNGVRSSLIQALLVLQNFPGEPPEMAGLTVEEVPITTDETKVDITFYIIPADDYLELEIEYDSSLFDEATAREFATEFTGILGAAAEDPNRRLSEVIQARRSAGTNGGFS